ncbi:MAG: hypothetical protein WCP77_21360, partial [Roseococcus sp.]
MPRAALGLLLLLFAWPVAAQERVAVRTGDHPGHGRIVFDWAAPPAYQVEQQGDRVILRFPNAEAINLAGAVNGNQTLTVAAGTGTLGVVGAVGGVTGLAGLTLTSTGGATFSAATTVNGAGGTVALDGGTGVVTFNGLTATA